MVCAVPDWLPWAEAFHAAACGSINKFPFVSAMWPPLFLMLLDSIYAALMAVATEL